MNAKRVKKKSKTKEQSYQLDELCFLCAKDTKNIEMCIRCCKFLNLFYVRSSKAEKEPKWPVRKQEKKERFGRKMSSVATVSITQ